MMDRGDTFFWEHHGNKAVRAGKWKLVSRVDIQNRKEGTWELYDMKNDRTETMDFSKIYPEKVVSLQYLYSLGSKNQCCNIFQTIGGKGKKKYFKINS